MKSSQNPSLTQFILFLSEPKNLPDSSNQVHVVQTHASVVAIADNFVYKLKKDVNFGFLNFSTLEKRKFYCEEEIRLNQRLTQGIYLEVSPIYWDGQALSFEASNGSIVNYVVKMRRMFPDGFLINQIKSDKFTSAQLDPLIKKLTHFYEHTEQLPADYPWPNNMKTTTAENFDGTQKFIGQTISPLAYQILKEDHAYFLEQHISGLHQRLASGKVKDCHGDIRAEHIHFQDEMIQIYDCIEFNTRFRFIDQLTDIAFLIMDLDYRDRGDLANYFRQKMLQSLETEPVDLYLHFFLAYRAIVRGKVNSMKFIDPEISPEVQAACKDKSERYFKLAMRYTLLGTAPTVVVLAGGVATGKSTLARALAQELNLQILNTDIIRKELLGLSPQEEIKKQDREWIYSAEMIQKTYDTLFQKGIDLAIQRGVIILDAGFRKIEHLQSLLKLCQSKGLRVAGLQTQAPEALVLQRLQAREGQAGASDMRLDAYIPERDNLQYALADYMENSILVDTSQTIAELLPDLFLKMKTQFRG